MTEERTDMAVHHAIVRSLIDNACMATGEELCRQLDISRPALEASLRRLEQNHSVVLHPHRCEAWIIHPFSTSPTHTWVEQGKRGWWAPCLWCGLGVAQLAGGDAVIHSRIGGESEPVQITVRKGIPLDPHLWVHFPEPPSLAWNNVHHFCARLLPFRSPDDVTRWSERHRLPQGQVLPLAQLADLARRWYGRHAEPDWRKATVAEAASIFRAVGLTGDFWHLAPREGVY